jgi:excisionase family DNA binding protein
MTNRNAPSPSGLMAVPGAAEYLGVSRQTVYEWKAQGTLAYVKLGRKLMFRKSDLDDFIQRNWVPAREEYPLAIKIEASRRTPHATHAVPKGHRAPREKRIETRIITRKFHSRPSARRNLLRIWRRARKG